MLHPFVIIYHSGARGYNTLQPSFDGFPLDKKTKNISKTSTNWTLTFSEPSHPIDKMRRPLCRWALELQVTSVLVEVEVESWPSL